VGTVDVFVSNDYDFVFVLGDNGLHRSSMGLLCGIELVPTDASRRFPEEISASIHDEINYG
jgi:hypothetical protein